MCKFYILISFLLIGGNTLAESNSLFLGKWEFITPNHCLETYIFQDDGEVIIKSKYEVNKKSYILKSLGGNQYHITFKTIKTNGLESCAGEGYKSEVGYEFSMIVNFHQSYDEFNMYVKGYEKYKLGPFIKKT